MTPTDLAYRTTAAQGASGFGTLIALYDTLVGDLRRAAAAQRARDLETRAEELKHALLVVGFLENWVEADSGDLAKKMIDFYSGLRTKIIEAQAKQSAAMMEEQMAEVLNIRQVWQQFEFREEASGPEILPPAQGPRYGSFHLSQMERRQLSWSA
jgi:flagellin-specific chaperone FliS